MKVTHSPPLWLKGAAHTNFPSLVQLFRSFLLSSCCLPQLKTLRNKLLLCFHPHVAMIQHEPGSNSSSFQSKSPHLVHSRKPKSVSPIVKRSCIPVVSVICATVCEVGVSLERIQKEAFLLAGGHTQRGALLRFLQTAACVGATPPALPGRMLIQLLPVFRGPPVPLCWFPV